MADLPIRMIRAGALLDGTGAPPQRDVVVVIAGQRITYVGPERNAPSVDAPPEQLIDARDGSVLPGLIDSHVHLTFNARTAATSPAVIEQLVTDDEATLGIRAVQAAQACLAVGITTVRDCGAKGLVAIRLRELIASGFINGPRILACGMPITTTAGHCNWLGQRADNEQEVVLATRRMVEAGADFIKVMSTGGGMTPTSNIYEPQYTVAELSAIVREATRLRRRVTAHSHSPSGQQACLEAGIGMIEHCNWHTPQGQCFDEALTQHLNAASVYLGITLSGPQQQAAMADQPFTALNPELQRRYEILRQMREMGSKIVLHSDAIAPITTYEAFPFSLIAAIRYGGFSLAEAIHAASGRAAEAIGLAGEIGTLAPGKVADILIVDGDIEQELRSLNRTRQVLRAGRILAERGAVRVTASTVPG